MSENRVAKRYARSLIGLANERNELELVHKDMQNFKDTIKESRDLALALKSPVLPTEKKKAILDAVFKDVHQFTKAFFDIITRKNRADLLPEIATEFHKQYNILSGIQVAQITTASPLTSEMREEFISLIKRISDKEKIQLQEKLNKDIIGGFVLTVGDKQIDDSLKSKLNQLRRELVQNKPYVKKL